MARSSIAAVPPGGEAAPPEPDRVPWTPQLLRVMAGLMLALFVVAMDSTVVGTALPTIARELGGFSFYSWIFAGYLLTGTTTVPIWGRLADLHGRRRVLLAGLAIFVLASVLCGLAPNMPALIGFRTLQGVGAGCLQPVIFTIVGDIFPAAQRARLQGFFSGMWAIAAVAGPLIGAAFVSTIGWRWIFDVNLPVGIVAVALLWGHREGEAERARGRIDYAGAAALTAGVGLLLWGLGAGSAAAPPVWPAVAAGVVLLAAFLLLQRRSAGSTVPLELLRHRVIGPAVLASLIAGTLMFGVTAYVPLFVQGALGGSAYAAGAAVAPMSFGWPVASILAGRILMRTGYRALMVAGALAMVLGAALLAISSPERGVAWLGLASAVIGFGLGLLSTPVLIVIQEAVDWNQRGSVTALNQFSRTIGGAVGVALMGILLDQRLAAAARAAGAAAAARNPLGAGAGGSAALIGAGVEAVFWVLLGLAVATLVTCLLILAGGRRRPAPSGALAG